ncbi:MAG TPA: small multi-drug export protein [Hydrogenophaga sp.]|uniref:small multi-drug export protein n=1 Tax=Hydrogenophaga sp. TaxID=1904254 RepID=UPI002C63FB31|nr:small multi-drug export protein [Hydrogenophaga sp.]HMN94266.1 small multi-drug export protein [Hydrogenophaga sp.]HMP11022.1 small multi-drug export protein [Hydrogenophaga sp.]
MSPLPPPETPALARSLQWRSILATDEGRWLALGLSLAALAFIGLGAAAHWWPAQVGSLAAMSGLNLIVGRAAGMAYGYASGLGQWPVIACNVLVETVQVLVVYSLFVLGCRQWLLPAWLTTPLARLRANAESGHAAVRRFGVVGLFVFVFMPFWMTGPVVGSIIGYLLGLRTRTTLAVVLGGTYVAIAAYALFLDEMDAWTSNYGQYAVFLVLLALAVLALLVQRWRRRG